MIIPNIWKNKKCSKPPISIVGYIFHYISYILLLNSQHVSQADYLEYLYKVVPCTYLWSVLSITHHLTKNTYLAYTHNEPS